jgi:hypothetical protein
MRLARPALQPRSQRSMRLPEALLKSTEVVESPATTLL